MFKVGIKNSFRSVHSLQGDFGPEAVSHEHEYTVEWICCTAGLDANGFAVDIALLEETLAEVISRIRGENLNRLEFFSERQVSVENLALFLHSSLSKGLEETGQELSTIRESEVRVWESDTAWASFISPGMG